MLTPYQQAELARFSAAFAATGSLTEDELWKPLERAHKPVRKPQPPKGQRKPRAREMRPEPAPSRGYSKAMASAVTEDQRLTPNAHRLATTIVRLCGRDGYANTCKRALAACLGLHPRSIARYLAELRRYGYITAEVRVNDRGWNVGLRIAPTDALKPYYVAKLQVVTDVSSQRKSESKSLKKESNHRANPWTGSQAWGPVPVASATCPLTRAYVFGFKEKNNNAARQRGHTYLPTAQETRR